MTFSRWLRKSKDTQELRDAFDVADYLKGDARIAMHRALIALAEKMYREAKENAEGN